MRRLRGQETLAVYDEENYNLREGLQDIRYAREFLKRVGDEERRRFNECSWYYGDPSLMGGSLTDIFDAQLATVLYTLFGSASLGSASFDSHGEGLRGEMLHTYPDFAGGDEGELLGDLICIEGGEVEPEILTLQPRRRPGATLAETLQDTDGGQSRYRPPYGPARYGYRLATGSVGDAEDIIAAEIIADPPVIADLATLVRAACGEGRAPRIYRWKQGSNPQRQLAPKESLIFLFGTDLAEIRELVHDVVFERLIGAWRQTL